MSATAQSGLLDFAPSDERAGFRLQRLEVLNWGTFDRQVWTLEAGGDNTLLTGDIGSGKSTLVDAVTTLLVPAQRITYNKAAGAEARERSLRSYVLGHYKSERSDEGLAAQSVALRDYNSYSVLLAHFYNEGFDQHVTLAQVFWMKETRGQPARFYVVADGALTIARDFADFGRDLKNLRKRLRDSDHVELHDSFPPYGAAFRRRFGIDTEQALELFNQTVSMKSVGNLTEFVRAHMLEAFPVEARIEQLINHFNDLYRAHEAVVRARRQIEALTPLVADADAHAESTAKTQTLTACREALSPWFAELKAELLEQRLANLDSEHHRLGARIDALTGNRGEQQGERDRLRQAIAEHGGDRIEELKAAIERTRAERDERHGYARRYNAVAAALELPEAHDADTFLANREALSTRREALESERDAVEGERREHEVAFAKLREQHTEVTTELESLRQRRSNLPSRMLAIREALCEALSLDEADLPFAGELIQVRDDARDWEGAIERLLHGFGLSLLVPDSAYAEVAQWVDRTHLGGRLVYYRVRDARPAPVADVGADSLVRRLTIKPDSGFYAWLEAELVRRFDYTCCTDMERFRREERAITRSGQIKSGGMRHEKDDRHRIDDRSRYILGWSNEAKIAALEKQAEDLASRMADLGQSIGRCQQRLTGIGEQLESVGKLSVFERFEQLDWRPLASRIEALESERAQLEAASDQLRVLQEQLTALEARLAETDAALDEHKRLRAKAEQKRENAVEALDAAREQRDGASEETRTNIFPQLAAMREDALGERTLTVESCDNRERDMRGWLQARIDAELKHGERVRDRVISAMQRFLRDYPTDAAEMDASLDAAGDFRALLERLRSDDLPRFEARFRALLKENAVREIAAFNTQLNNQRQTIQERIDTINRSLHDIDYNPGRYIHLVAEPATDAEIRDFRQELRACTEHAVGAEEESDEQAEARFLQVKAIIERFQGREGTTELDRRWTRKVTDVRNWFTFSASERWREDDAEYEHYTDSGGKSGGQKEKLAYTVLAASLAYQFGLEWGETRSRSFRFVVIDEAFGRGSDESARYGLALFKRLNLQLLVITPLQKIHIIEPYVASVGFVHNEGGRRSLLRNLSIEEYRAEREARQRRAGG
ncbi:ATP-binding protein [Arhodomonas sp. AD133]|uniref:ATP-binding protein n=1 Tax=Arhodomonas sp. AD133 TaxID=3415009 RepID=UPI003EB6DEF9